MLLGINYNDWQVIGVILSATISTSAFLWTLFESRRNSRESKLILEESTRGFVSIYSNTLLANNSIKSYFVLKNIGNSPLQIFDVDIDDETRESLKLGGTDFIDYLQFTSLDPGKSATISFNSSNFDKDHISEIEVQYKTIGKIYTEKRSMNLSILSQLPSVGISEIHGKSNDEQLVHYLKQFIELYQDDLRKRL